MKRTWTRKPSLRPTSNHRTRSRPAIEALEPRLVLSTFTVSSAPRKTGT